MRSIIFVILVFLLVLYPLPFVAEGSNNEVEAYSDTTESFVLESSDTVVIPLYNDFNDTEFFSDNIFKGTIYGMIALSVLIFLFPLLLLIVVIYLIRRNIKERKKLEKLTSNSDQFQVNNPITTPHCERVSYVKGIKITSLGVGLVLFFAIINIKIGMGLGALIACYGAGQIIITRISHKKERDIDLEN